MGWWMDFLNQFKTTPSSKNQEGQEILLEESVNPVVTSIGVDAFVAKWATQSWMNNTEFERAVTALNHTERGEVFNRCLSYKFNSTFFQERLLQEKLDILLRLGMNMSPDSLGRYPFQTLCVRQSYQYGDEKQLALCEQKALALLNQTNLDEFFKCLFHRLDNSNREQEPTLWHGLYDLIDGHYHQVLKVLVAHPLFPEWVKRIDKDQYAPILFRAVWAKNIRGFEMLLQHGADPNQWAMKQDVHSPSQSLLHFLLFEMDKNPGIGLPQQYFLKSFLSKENLQTLFQTMFEMALQYGADPYYEAPKSTLGTPYEFAVAHVPEKAQMMVMWAKYHEDQKALTPLREIPITPSKSMTKRL